LTLNIQKTRQFITYENEENNLVKKINYEITSKTVF